jgi:hypothetical protein
MSKHLRLFETRTRFDVLVLSSCCEGEEKRTRKTKKWMSDLYAALGIPTSRGIVQFERDKKRGINV